MFAPRSGSECGIRADVDNRCGSRRQTDSGWLRQVNREGAEGVDPEEVVAVATLALRTEENTIDPSLLLALTLISYPDPSRHSAP